ncbi:hypothetical protein Pst134EA_031322 [Puccinia striiformis f. sp. tritici]|uniref:uncharacterized protein n=1 Tax=Puccinia striiformis f. sp. tritici TaxID=168172 RepID=UPI0020075682|nr:uncharacterized protein Pst134EA_031322 [Puccinia striiformis f. sp. tritici]KAH9445375.1 hypothetical protein Pst134EA_031322 [Puccinia striiformis f. sp. tritici]
MDLHINTEQDGPTHTILSRLGPVCLQSHPNLKHHNSTGNQQSRPPLPPVPPQTNVLRLLLNNNITINNNTIIKYHHLSSLPSHSADNLRQIDYSNTPGAPPPPPQSQPIRSQSAAPPRLVRTRRLPGHRPTLSSLFSPEPTNTTFLSRLTVPRYELYGFPQPQSARSDPPSPGANKPIALPVIDLEFLRTQYELHFRNQLRSECPSSMGF